MEKVGCVMPASPLRLLLKEYMDRLGSLRSDGKLDASTYGAEVAACEHLRKNPEAIESATLSNCFYAWGNRSLFSEAERRGYVRFLMAVLLKGQSLSFHMCMCKLEAQLRLEVLLNDMQYVQNDGARELCHNEAPRVVSMVVRDMMSLLAPTPKILRDRTVTKWVKYIEGYYDKNPLVAKMVKEMRRMRKYLEMLESEDTLSKACISQEEVDELRSQFHNCVQRLSYFREELRLSALAEFTELSDKRSERSKGRRNDGGRYSSEYDFNVSLLWKLIGDIWDDCARIPFVLCVPFTRIRLLSFYGVLGPINNAATIDKFRGSQACNDGSAFEDVCMTSHWPTIVQRIVVPHCAELIRLHGMEEPLADESLVEPLARDWVSWCLQKNDENHSEPTGLWTHELPLYTRYSNCTILKQGKSVGELDAVIVDARQSNVLFVLEIKRNIADVEKAVKQRNRFFEMVDTSPIQLKCGTETLTMENLAAFFRNKDAEDDSPGRNARWVIVTSAPRDLSSCTALPAPGPVRHLIENALVRICEEALLHADPRADDAWRARDVVLNSSFLCQPSSNTGVYTPLTLPLELADPDSNLVPPPDMSVMDFFVQHLSPTTLAAHPIRLSSNLPLLDLIDRVRDPSTTFESVAEKMCPPKQPQPSFISLVKELVGHGSLRTLILVKELASTDDSS